MKTKHTLATTAIAAAFALNMSTTAADAGHGDDLSRYAQRVEAIAFDLEDEFRLQYRHLNSYCHMRSDIAEIIRKARRIDGLTRDCHSSLRYIAADLSALDGLASHLRELVGRAESSRHGRRAHGDRRHVHCLLSSLNGAIDSMQAITARMRFQERHDDRRYDRGQGERTHRDRGHSDRAAHYERGRSSRGHSYSRAEFGNEVLRFVIESHARRGRR